ncbi:MAG: helix-turn-helix domain-containing protein [Ruminococcaceae bacterium]|nr:helix-turn-helix domain-containing protein [Oscillospiraceae bacterium]
MLKQRLISARKGAGLTQAEVADYLGIRRQTYSAYERGVSTPDANTVATLARLFGVGAGELVAGEVSTNVIKVPVCGNVAAGIPIDAIEDVEEYVDVDASLAKGATLIGLRVKGRSMEPRFTNGDTVIIRCQSSVDNGDIAVVLVGDEATMKKVVRYTEGIRLMPTNPAYEPRYFSNEEIASLPVTIIGKVVELRAKI